MTLASRHGAVVHGLNTNPNLSLTSLQKIPEDFKFKNKKPTLTKGEIDRLSEKTVLLLFRQMGLDSALGRVLVGERYSIHGRSHYQISFCSPLSLHVLRPIDGQ